MMKIVSSILFAFTLLISNQMTAQDIKRSTSVSADLYEYFIFLSGVTKKSDVVEIQDKIRLIKEVNYFLADRFPVRYFRLVTTKKITKENFANWLEGTPYKIDFFEYGTEKKENAIMYFNKLNKSTN